MSDLRILLMGILAVVLAQPVIGAEDAPDGYTMSDYRETVLRFHRETFLEIFEQRADPKAEWYRDAMRCIEESIRHFAAMPDRELNHRITQPGSRAVKAGCEDPLLLYAYGAASGKIEHLERALAGMIERGDPVHRQAFAAIRLAREHRDEGHEHEARKYFEQAADLHMRMVDAGSYGRGMERPLFGALELLVRKDLPLDLAKRMCDGLKAREAADPWVVKMIVGVHEIRMAWEKRSGRWASEVRDEQWEGFRHHLDLAYRSLTEAYELHPDRPEAAAYLVTVAMGGGCPPGENERFWFDRAIKAQIDWPPAYGRMLTALLPRWGGSYAQIYEFGLECMSTGRYDTRVPFILVDAILTIAEDMDDRAILSDDGVYEDVKEMVENYRQAGRGRRMPVGYQLNDRYWGTLLAGFATLTARYETALALIEGIDNKIMAAPLEILALDTQQFFEDIYACTGDFGGELEAARTAVEKDEGRAAIELYRSVLAELPEPSEEDRRRWRRASSYREGDFDLHRWLRDRLRPLELHEALQDGNWVDLPFDPDLSGWTTAAGRWYFIDERTVSGTSSRDGLILVHDLPVGLRWELRGTFRFPETTEQQQKHSAAVYFHGRRGFSELDWQGVGFHPKLDQTLVQRRWFTEQVIELDTRVHPVGRFHIQVWDDEVVAYLDGRLVFAGATPGEGNTWQPGPHFGIGGFFWYRFVDLQFSELQIHLLTERPKPLAEAARDRDAH